jgi:hypothetical protein
VEANQDLSLYYESVLLLQKHNPKMLQRTLNQQYPFELVHVPAQKKNLLKIFMLG